MIDNTIDIFKAIGEEVRLRILFLLIDKELCTCNLENILKISQPGISQHILKLKNAGLINVKKKGKWKIYSLSAKAKKIFNTSIIDIISSLKKDDIIKNDIKSFNKYYSKCNNLDL